MKKKLFVPALFLLFSAGVSAQISVGIQGGGVYSKPDAKLQTSFSSLDYQLKGRLGYSAGLIADLPFGESGFRLIPELVYSTKGAKADASFSFLGQNISINGKSTINYIDLPVHFGYAVPLGGSRLVLGAGPYGSVGIYGNSVTNTTTNGVAEVEEKKDVSFGDAADQTKRFDYGASFMAGFIMENGLMIKANFGLGLANISNREDSDYRNRHFGLSLAYFFVRGGK